MASGCFVNVTISEEGVLFLTDEYMTFCGKTDRDVTTVVALDESVNVYGELPVSTDAYEEMALLAQLSAGEYQYMILDEAGLERFAQLELYADLEEILDEESCLTLRDLQADGRDLMDIGFPPGKLLGSCLAYLLEQVQEEVLPNEKQALLTAAKDFLKHNL